MTEHSDPGELLPCPFCGATDGQLIQAFTRATADFAYWSVECIGCGAEIADDESQASADAHWNTRTPATPIDPSEFLTPEQSEARMAREGDWRGVGQSIAHSILPLASLASGGTAHRAKMQIVAGDRLCAAIAAAAPIEAAPAGDGREAEEGEPAEWAMQAERAATEAYASFMGDPNDEGFDDPSDARRAAALAIEQHATRAFAHPNHGDPSDYERGRVAGAQEAARAIARYSGHKVHGNFAQEQAAEILSLIPTDTRAESDEQTAWLVEEGSGPFVHWITLSDGPWPLTKSKMNRHGDAYVTPIGRVKDASEALRFARREDAEAFIAKFNILLLDATTTEHSWSDTRAEPKGGEE